MSVVLTKALIEASRTGNSGYRKKQLLALGVGFPPKSGWIERLIGTEVSDEQYERFLGHRTSKQAEQILRGEQPAKGHHYSKRAQKLASEQQATIDLDDEHLSDIEKYLVRDS
jgi:hypothetical protein